MSDKKSRKFVMMSVYTILAFVIIYFFFRKRNPEPPATLIQSDTKKEDKRPRISVSGSLIGPSELQTLSKIGKFSRLHLVFKVRNDEQVAQIKEMMKEVSSLSEHRVIFCDTDVGYKAVLRQLSPRLHVENNLQLARDMSAYLNAISIVGDDETENFYQIFEFKDCEAMVVNILNDLH